MDLTANNRYKLGRKIGSGSCGDIFLATNIVSGEEVAVKLESVKTKHPQLLYESKLYRERRTRSRLIWMRAKLEISIYDAILVDAEGCTARTTMPLETARTVGTLGCVRACYTRPTWQHSA